MYEDSKFTWLRMLPLILAISRAGWCVTTTHPLQRRVPCFTAFRKQAYAGLRGVGATESTLSLLDTSESPSLPAAHFGISLGGETAVWRFLIVIG